MPYRTVLADGLNVYKYIIYLLEKRSTEEMPDSELEKLLPWNDKVFRMYAKVFGAYNMRLKDFVSELF